ncbi:hypothetical protein RWA05_23110 (plasmid) [Sinorhizobium meliloti]
MAVVSAWTATSIPRRWAAFSIVCWVGDDPGSFWCEGVAGDRPYGHAQRLPRLVADGAGDAEARSDVMRRARLCGGARLGASRGLPNLEFSAT